MEWGPIVPDIDTRPPGVGDWDKVMLLDQNKKPLPLGESGWYAKGAPWGNLAIKFLQLRAGHPFYSNMHPTTLQPAPTPTVDPITHVTLVHASGKMETLAVVK